MQSKVAVEDCRLTWLPWLTNVQQKHLFVFARNNPVSASDLLPPFATRIESIRFVAGEVCIGLQDLELPALLTLLILDELFPNNLPMFKLWRLVTMIKHWKSEQKVDSKR
jgi:hypothetical protein